jgi:putative flippase GtrA
MLRFVKFNAVGLIGFMVQMGMLVILVDFCRWPYLWATLVAVEVAVLHNFMWHRQWTWRDRAERSLRGLLTQLGRFQLLNGATSLGGNTVMMVILVGSFHMPVLVAGVLSVAVCTVANFLWAHLFVFSSAASLKVD